MTDERSLADDRTEIERRLDAALGPANGDRLAGVRETMAESDDRWYGQLLVRSADSAPDSADSAAVLSAAAAIELLRGYCRLRSELLVQIANDAGHSLTRDPTSAVLAGDRLDAAAYSTLGEIDHASLGRCFEVLTDVSERIVEAFSTDYGQSTPPDASRRALIDDTTGALGEGAAVIGATLAGVDGDRRNHFATLGRGLGTGRQIHRMLDSERGSVRVARLEQDERGLRQHAEQRLTEADRALRELSSVADVNRFRPLVEEIEGDVGADR